MARAKPNVHGVVTLDKPEGPTSFDVVAQVRRVYATKAVGHAGTLDPLATGVLVVMLGEATKLSEYLTAQDKTYVAEIAFGRSTDTLDITGTTLEQRDVTASGIDPTAIERAIQAERVRQWQVPPEYSAIKIAGQPAYARARRGETLALAPRPVRVTELEVLQFAAATLRVRLRVSKGYYVRSFVRDLCAHLNVPGCMRALRRTASGHFGIDDCVKWPVPEGGERPVPLSVSQAAQRALPSGVLTDEGVVRARQGKRLLPSHFHDVPAPSVSAWLDAQGKLVALGERAEPHDELEPSFRVIRGFLPDCV